MSTENQTPTVKLTDVKLERADAVCDQGSALQQGKDHKDITFPPDPGKYSSNIQEEDHGTLTTTTDTAKRVIAVHLSGGESLVVPILVNGQNAEGVLDSGAECCLLSEEYFKSMTPPPPILDRVSLNVVGQGIVPAFEIAIELKVGSTIYKGSAYVSKLCDDCLLGLDFMKAVLCDILISESCIWIGGQFGEKVPALFKKFGQERFHVSRVTLAKRTVIPPNSIKIADVMLMDQLDQDKSYCIEPRTARRKALVAATITPGLKETRVQIVNDHDVFITLKPGDLIGIATEVKELEQQMEPSKEDKWDKTPEPKVIQRASIKTILTKQQMEDSLPTHLTMLFKTASANLTESQALTFGEALHEYLDVFATHDLDIGCLKEIQHKIDTGDNPPLRQRLRRTPLGFEKEEQKHLQRLLDVKVITPSTSEWASPTVLIWKPDGSIQYCLDYRELNKRTVKDSYPLPLIEECLDTLAGTIFFSLLDMANGYYQIEVDQASRAKTAFITKYGLFEHTRMGFGLCNAPATFQRAMMLVLRGLSWTEVLAYLDDVIVLGRSFEDHLDNIKKVFQQFRDHSLKLKPRKCFLFQKEVPFLGKLVNASGVHVAPAKIEAVKKWATPTTKEELQIFLGFANYHRDHIKHYAEMSHPLYILTRPKSEFEWTQGHDTAFQEIKKALITAPCLAYPTATDPFILDTDASEQTIGAELLQIQDGKECVISYASNTLIREQVRWCTTRKELLAVVKFTRHFRHYLLSKQFLIRTDHNCLVWLMHFKSPEGQLAQWLEELSQYDFRIEH